MADFTLYRGADRAILFDWDTNITGATITFVAKSSVKATAPVLTKSTADGGITITDASAGTGKVNIDETDFDELASEESDLYCTLWLSLGGRTIPRPFTLAVVRVAQV